MAKNGSSAGVKKQKPLHEFHNIEHGDLSIKIDTREIKTVDHYAQFVEATTGYKPTRDRVIERFVNYAAGADAAFIDWTRKKAAASDSNGHANDATAANNSPAQVGGPTSGAGSGTGSKPAAK